MMFYEILKSKYFHTITLLLLISITVGGCGGKSSTEPITDITWQWSEMVETEPASQSLVPNSESYTLLFSSEGTVSILADCNMVSGSYIIDGNKLSLELGPSTMAFCGEESLDLMYLGFLSNVGIYSIEDNQLVLELKEGAGRMTFSKE